VAGEARRVRVGAGASPICGGGRSEEKRRAKQPESPSIRTSAGGRPCLRGLRIRVASRDELLADYPLLEDADITPALEYAARSSDHPVLRVA
jgi:uncharacterized protein (DUF433 family)